MNRHTNFLRRALRCRGAVCLLIVSLAACESETPATDLDVQQLQKLIVLTRNAPTMYYEGRDGPTGFEHDLVQAYARRMGLEPEFRVLDNVDDILDQLAAGQGHMAAAGLTATQKRRAAFLTSMTYQTVRQQVVCHRAGAKPSNVSELAGLRVAVPVASSYAERLRQLQREHDALRWEEEPEADTEALIERVWLRQLDCTVADSNIVAINRRYYPEVAVRFDLSAPQDLVWYLPKRAARLQTSVNRWFTDMERSGGLQLIKERHYGFVEVFDYVDTRVFLRRAEERLPGLLKLFQQAGAETGVRPLLLAAQSYQESHWDPAARSPTGVRGLMMLTQRTARELGVRDRTDPAASVLGGARYLARIRDRLPADVVEPDRTWIALAAYNVGLGHVYDAMELARRHGREPYRWSHLKKMLPMLSNARVYKTLRHGYARGREPVRYVTRVRHFHDLLRRAVVLPASTS